MPKYIMTIEVEAEQFLPNQNKFPLGVIPDGPRSPRTDPRASWVLKTDENITYLADGDYILTTISGAKYTVQKDLFERDYKLLES